MSAWTWACLDSSGAQMSGTEVTGTTFDTQSDAESWIGQEWRELADAGVAAVTLYEDGEVVYGPMSLADGL